MNYAESCSPKVQFHVNQADVVETDDEKLMFRLNLSTLVDLPELDQPTEILTDIELIIC